MEREPRIESIFNILLPIPLCFIALVMHGHVKVDEVVLLFSCQSTDGSLGGCAGSESFCPPSLVVDKATSREPPAHPWRGERWGAGVCG